MEDGAATRNEIVGALEGSDEDIGVDVGGVGADPEGAGPAGFAAGEGAHPGVVGEGQGLPGRDEGATGIEVEERLGVNGFLGVEDFDELEEIEFEAGAQFQVAIESPPRIVEGSEAGRAADAGAEGGTGLDRAGGILEVALQLGRDPGLGGDRDLLVQGGAGGLQGDRDDFRVVERFAVLDFRP